MKKMLMVLAVVLVGTEAVIADSYTYTYDAVYPCTNTSAAIPVSGWLDKIELSATSIRTSTVVVATYDGTTAIDTLGTVTLTTGAKVIRLRVQPTDNTGTVIPAVASGTDATNTTTMLTVPYEKVLIGGNLKITVGNITGGTSANKVVIYYEPTKK